MKNKFQRLQGQEWQKVKDLYKLKLILITNEGHIRGEYVKIENSKPVGYRYNVSHYLNDDEVAELKSNQELFDSLLLKGLEKLVKKENKHKPKEEYNMNAEEFSRDKFVEAIEKIFGSVDNFLDIVEDDDVYGYDIIKYEDEIYIIDTNNCQYIHWYKLTHIGRDFTTDIKTWDGVIEFLTRLKIREEK